MQKVEKPKKPLVFYYFIVLVVMVLLNTMLFPRLMRQEITQVDYGTFLTMLAQIFLETSVPRSTQSLIHICETSLISTASLLIL